MNARTHTAVIRKVEPIRTSGKFRAILGYLLGQRWTEPEIVALMVTSDGMLLASHEDDGGMLNDFIGPVECLLDNLRGLAKVAGLTKVETAYLVGPGKSLSLGPRGGVRRS